MKIVRHKTTFTVYYLFNNGDDCRLDQYGMWGEVRALDMKEDTHEIIEDVPYQDVFVGGAYGYDTDWFVINQERIDEQYDAQVQKEIEDKCEQVMSIRLAKTYSDITVQFPDGYGEIQFRNDFDRSNFGDVAAGAQAMALVDPDTMMYYRTSDNVIHPVACGVFIELAVYVLLEKQNIVSASWVHKDTLRAFTTLEQVRQYNINEGWPS